MKLSKQAIERMSDRKKKLQLAMDLDFTELWISKLIAANEDESALTTIKALRSIETLTGLSIEDILEEDQVEATK